MMGMSKYLMEIGLHLTTNSGANSEGQTSHRTLAIPLTHERAKSGCTDAFRPRAGASEAEEKGQLTSAISACRKVVPVVD
jgi:hypothetical protein